MKETIGFSAIGAEVFCWMQLSKGVQGCRERKLLVFGF